MSQIPGLSTTSQHVQTSERKETSPQISQEISVDAKSLKDLMQRITRLEVEKSELKQKFQDLEIKNLFNQLWSPSDTLRFESVIKLSNLGEQVIPYLIGALKLNAKVDRLLWKSDDPPIWKTPAPLWDYIYDLNYPEFRMFEGVVNIISRIYEKKEMVPKVKMAVNNLLEDMLLRGLKLHSTTAIFDVTAFVYYLGNRMGLVGKVPDSLQGKINLYISAQLVKEIGSEMAEIDTPSILIHFKKKEDTEESHSEES